jgi:sugar/nucleoside kinase (ribokinase family)
LIDLEIKNSLLEKLKQIKEIESFNVVMLPDFFVDHFVTIDSYESGLENIKKIYDQGGGNIPKYPHVIQQGGNAANTALGLSRLGVNVDLICKTNKLGGFLLKKFLGTYGVNLDGVKTDGELSSTVALEFGQDHVNVMLNDPGSLADFSFDTLDEKDLEKISKSDIVGVVNWSQNKVGTELAEKVFSFAKKNNVKTFFDSGDPAHRKEDISELLEKVVFSEKLDVFSLNKNELKHYTGMYNLNDKNDFLYAVDSLNEKASCRLDIHTSDFACSFKKNKEKTVVPTLDLKNIVKATGSGDSWNAASIFGELIGLNDKERVLFANCFAGFYISNSSILPPDLEEIITFIESEV